MFRKVALFPLVLAFAACSSTGTMKNPFVKEKPFVATSVPTDFAIVIDENHDTYYARQHIQQTISASTSMSETVYTTYRDYNNTVSNRFSQETPLSAVQLQNMWNDVARNNLMESSSFWINWLSDSDLYKKNTYTLQIRANGKARIYRPTNGFSGKLRPLMLQVQAVRLPITQDSTTPVVGAPGTRPAAGSMTQPETEPATEPMPPVSSGMSDHAITPATAP